MGFVKLHSRRADTGGLSGKKHNVRVVTPSIGIKKTKKHVRMLWQKSYHLTVYTVFISKYNRNLNWVPLTLLLATLGPFRLYNRLLPIHLHATTLRHDPHLHGAIQNAQSITSYCMPDQKRGFFCYPLFWRDEQCTCVLCLTRHHLQKGCRLHSLHKWRAHSHNEVKTPP